MQAAGYPRFENTAERMVVGAVLGGLLGWLFGNGGRSAETLFDRPASGWGRPLFDRPRPAWWVSPILAGSLSVCSLYAGPPRASPLHSATVLGRWHSV
jgi:hypothetical protein